MEWTLTAVIAVILGVLLLKFATKILFKLLGFALCVLAAVVFMYVFSWGPFKKNITQIQTLEEKYCEEERDDDICECIVAPLKLDMIQRFSNEELEAISQDKIKSFRILTKSMDATKGSSLGCLSERGAEDKYNDFLLDFAQLDKEDIDFIRSKGKEIGDWIKDKADSLGESFEEIDERYQ